MNGADVVVVGGGLIGTATAWRLAQAGLDVALVVGERSLAASRVAAGMLAPVTETTFTERTLLALNQASGERWPTFADEVVEASGQPSGLRRGPTLSVASDADDLARLRTFADYLERQGLAAERLTSRECRTHEPLLAPTVRGGLLVPSDWSCDNRVLLEALTTATERAGVRTVAGFVRRVESEADRVTGVTLADGTTLATDLAEPSAAYVDGGELVVVESSAHRLTRLPLGAAGTTTDGFSHTTQRPVTEVAAGVELVVAFTPPPGQKVDERFGPATQLVVEATPPALLRSGAGRDVSLVRTLELDPHVGEGVLHVAARAASCDADGGEGAACRMHQQDWGVPVRIAPGAPAVLELPLGGTT